MHCTKCNGRTILKLGTENLYSAPWYEYGCGPTLWRYTRPRDKCLGRDWWVSSSYYMTCRSTSFVGGIRRGKQTNSAFPDPEAGRDEAQGHIVRIEVYETLSKLPTPFSISQPPLRMVSRTSDEHSQSSVEASTPHDAEKQENQHVINQSALPSGHGTEQSKEELEKDTNLIELEGPDDPINPQLMSNGKKWFLCAVLGCMTLVVTFASSVFSTATQVVAAEYHVGLITSTLGTGLFVFGFSAG